MAKKIKLKKDSTTVYPLTIPGAVIDPSTQNSINEIFATKNELNEKANKRDVKVISSNNYTLNAEDVNYFLIFTSNTDVTFFVSDVLPSKEAYVKCVQYGDGNINISGVGQTNLRSNKTITKTSAKNEVFEIIRKDQFNFVLNFSGSGGASVSETTETFTYGGGTQTFTTQNEYSNMSVFRNGVLLVDPAQYNLYPTAKYVEVLDNLNNNEIITLKYTAE